MGELLAKLINEAAAKKEEEFKKRFTIKEEQNIQYLILIDENGNEINKVKLNPNSDCCTCPHYVGQCSCNCNGIG